MIDLRKKTLFIIVAMSIGFTNLFSGLLPGTNVLVGDDCYKRVEDLRKGDSIVVYSIPDQRVEDSLYRIQKIKKRKSREIIIIDTGRETVVFGPRQKVYNRNVFKFIPAGELKVGDRLFSPELGNLKIRNIVKKKLEEKICLYDISIENGNLFLILTENGKHLLVHNFAITLTILTWTFGGDILITGIGALAAALGLQLASELLKGGAKKSGFDVSGYQTRGELLDNLCFNEGIPTIGDSCPIDKVCPDDSIEDLKKNSNPGRKTNGKSEQWERPGGLGQATEDFDVRVSGKTTDFPGGKAGKLPDGRKINVREDSTDGRPTLEVVEKIGKYNKHTKFRYDD